MNRGQINLLDEIITDNFAGGGGASTGIELATGRVVNIAINHDPDAILMHKTNHPHTEHIQASVWDVDPKAVCRGRKVGLAWFSPDCKHFSKAKGSALVDRNIRGLAWIVLRWAGTVRPRVIIVENVEEFQTWGPVRKGKPVKKLTGQTFRKWRSQLENLGYAVEHRELVAADYGAPTTRKRFFLVARCDGRPIVWPEPTHAPRDSEEVRSGKRKPWRSAAEIIDWSQPCYSIFASKAELKSIGVKAVRPLADNTMRRCIRGVDKFTIRSGKPFIVEANHTSTKTHYDTFRGGSVDDPMRTITAAHGRGVCDPLLAPVTVTNTTNSVGSAAGDPLHTVTTAGNQMLVVPNLMQIGQTGGGDRIRSLLEPTATTVSKAEACMVTPCLIQYHTEQSEKVRGQEVADPIMTVDASNRYGLVSASLVEYYSTGRPLNIDEPMHTVTSHDREAVVASHLVKFKGQDLGQHPTTPLQTVTTSAGEFAECRTVLAKVGSGDFGYWPQIRALLNKHCGYHLEDDEILLLNLRGVLYYIADIGLRMLTPRELYNAMGFPVDYIIDRDYLGNEYGKTKQVARCGNAVPPPFATALVRANLPEWCGGEIHTMEQLERMVAV